MPSAEEIFDTFPEFAESEGKDIYLELAELEQADLWNDDRYNQAIAYRAAHQMEIAGLGTFGLSAAGNVTSERIGSLSVSYGNPGNGNWDWNLANTKYGRLLMELLQGAIMSPRTSYG